MGVDGGAEDMAGVGEGDGATAVEVGTETVLMVVAVGSGRVGVAVGEGGTEVATGVSVKGRGVAEAVATGCATGMPPKAKVGMGVAVICPAKPSASCVGVGIYPNEVRHATSKPSVSKP